MSCPVWWLALDLKLISYRKIGAGWEIPPTGEIRREGTGAYVHGDH